MGQMADMVLGGGKLAMGYAESLLKGVQASQFARLAAPAGVVVKSNHPAWVYGHLAVYPGRCLELLGQPNTLNIPKHFDELFKNGTPCLDDPAGTIYPSMAEITKVYFDGYRAVLAALERASDEAMLRPNPGEGRMKEMFPTCGAAVNFLICGHHLIHFGQISAWRRMVGLPSAM
jgi:hypothetical protein